MYIKIISRTGHFNFCDTSQESVSTFIGIYNEEEKVKSVNIETEYEVDIDNFEPDEIVDEVNHLIEEQLKKVWISTSKEEWREMIKFLDDNRKEITLGQVEYKIKCLNKSEEELKRKLDRCRHNIGVYANLLEDLKLNPTPPNPLITKCQIGWK